MTCKHCCGADQLFDLKGAKKELRKYKRKGPGNATKKLIDLMFNDDVTNKSLIDIGGGIGAIQWAFLKKGGKSVCDIDASNGYIAVAKTFAEEQGYGENVRFVQGDFVEKSIEISNSDYTTLDKVICCYPDYKSLLSATLKKCNSTIGIVYPFGGLLPKAVAKLEMIYFWIRNIQFGTYIHNPKEVEKFVLDQGFEIIEKSTSFLWHIQIYRKKEM